jgi:hypothetical protein
MPPEHSAAWLAGATFGGALVLAGIALEYADVPHGRHVGAFLASLGIIATVAMLAGYSRHHRIMTKSPLIIRKRPCCEQISVGLRHMRLEVFNSDKVYTIGDVELHVDVVGDQWSQEGRLLKWVGEAPSKRSIAAGEWPHFELGGVVDQKPYFVFWRVPGAVGSDPRAYARDYVQPGDYKVTVVIRSQRQPATHQVLVSCTTSSIVVTSIKAVA